jgi:hypothetical protein
MTRLEQRGAVAFTCMEIAVPADHRLGISVLANHPDRDPLARPECSGSSGFTRLVVPSKRLDRNPDAIPGGDDGGGEGTP